MTSPHVDHLIFSTRAARPESGTDFNRGIVASSEGVADDVRNAFAVMADITGTVLGRHELPPIYSFSRVSHEAWLFCRAVSLGFYRKRSHQLLVHGVVLTWGHLDWLGGNPFVLEHLELPEEEFAFRREHPGNQGRLEKMHLDPRRTAGIAPTVNRQRFATLGRELASLDEAFPSLYDLVLDRDRRVACTVPERPDWRLAEWLLLHFHPHDRAELSFSTWYSYEHPVEYRLMLAPEADRGLLRQHFKDRLAPVSVGQWPSRQVHSPEALLGQLARDLRQRSPERFLDVLERYHLTFWVQAEEAPPVLDAQDVSLGFRYELDPESLTPEEKEQWRHLEGRARNDLAYHVRHLASRWKNGVADFEVDLAKREAGRKKVTPDQVPSALAKLSGDGSERWALAVLLRSDLRDDDPEWEEVVPRTWREIVPPDLFEELLAFFDAGAERSGEVPDHVERHLEGHVEEAARREARAGATGKAEPSYWPAYLRWRRDRGLPLAGAAARVERVLDDASEEVLLAWSPLLQEICFSAGLPAFAYRLIFQKQAPRLSGEAFEDCVRGGVFRLLGDDGRGDAVLGPALGDPKVARAALLASVEWLRGSAEPTAAWNRWLDLFEKQREALAPEAAESAGRFLAIVAASHLGDRLLQALNVLVGALPAGGDRRDAVLRQAGDDLTERAAGPVNGRFSPHLPRGLAGFLAARLRQPTDESVDRKILDLLLRGLVHADATEEAIGEEVARGRMPEAAALYHRSWQETLRKSLDDYLALLLGLGRFPRLLDAPDAWRRLLLDELVRRPPELAAADARYRAYMLLAWSLWSRDQNPLSEVAVQRMFPWEPSPGPAAGRATWQWHQDLIEEALSLKVVREDQDAAARELLLPAA